MDWITNTSSMALAGSWSLPFIALISSFLFSLISIPLCRKLAHKLGVVDKPGGRKEHAQPTALLGGLGLVLSCTLAIAVVLICSRLMSGGDESAVLVFGDIKYILIGSLILFFTGLIDDLIGERLAFYYKLIGQIVGSCVAMGFLFYAQLIRLVQQDVPFADYLYLIILLLWMLTVINSFNFSDNINGLSSGLAVITLLIAMVYLGAQFNTRFVILALVLVGAIGGFLPFNFPKARIFLGDAGSLFIGYWVGVILWPMTSGFFDGKQVLWGVDNLIPPALVMGVPLYDAAYVVFIRWKEKRPVYLGDNKHLSHRLVRSGFSKVEAVLMLWGIALIVGGIGALSMSGEYYNRYMALMIVLSFLLIITILIMRQEKKELARAEKIKQGNKVDHGSSRIRTNVSS